ncbi:hypothetical protein H4R99_005856 [Coemansia sp. RSA 1722]|nr:hypothetical protein LPJ57_002408 [Coemansia sp. RSA 486]KAJ2229178.1 hypothetical protein IWW45_006304 [Coemansia sp. RSA 485]KAJ2594290.1 hypothetical protein H4R99_005856 [Coemansia sp. RSA 1722]
MHYHYALASFFGTLLTGTFAHVSMRSPCVRYTPFCNTCPELPAGQSLDENINAPIGTHDAVHQPLCKYTTPYGSPAARWKAGSTVSVDFNPHAAVHGGGHCQFALSYDGGNTFVVVHDELRYCFTGGPSSSNSGSVLQYDIKLPGDLPSADKVVFAWAWNNAIGNREFYMNCADVAIDGVAGGSFSGPQMLVANYGPDTPFIPEFNGDYETGINLYNSRKMVSVGGSGSYSNATAGTAAVAPLVPAPLAPSSSSAPAAGYGSGAGSSDAPIATASYSSVLPPIIGPAGPTMVPGGPAAPSGPEGAPYVPPYSSAPSATQHFSTAPVASAPTYAVSSAPLPVATNAPVYHARVAAVPVSVPAALPSCTCVHVVKKN